VLESLTHAETWVALFQISVINILLSGDNAVVIALACKDLPAKQQKQAFAIGAGGVVILMTALTGAAAYLLTLPYLEVVGSALLLWIGIKLLSEDSDEGEVRQSKSFWGAVRTIIIADIVMSLDNVLGMAGAAKGHLGMLFVGMVITIPLILFGSALIMKLMNRFPVFITFGAGLLGWVAGEMAIADPLVEHTITTRAHYLEFVAPLIGAFLVVVTGHMLARRRRAEQRDAPEAGTGVEGDGEKAPEALVRRVVFVIQEGSDIASAAEHVIDLCSRQPAVDVHLLCVRHPFPQYVSRFIAGRELAAFHHERGMAVLKAAAERLDARGIRHADHVLVGDKAQTIVQFARDRHCDQIILAKQARGPIAGLVLGSLDGQIRHLIGAAGTSAICEVY
jgi:YjbE family integral membrane protein